MKRSQPTPAGQRLLDRRQFLGDAATGLQGIAIASLLAQGGLLAAPGGGPLRPAIDPTVPLSARTAHFAPRAKRVLMLFCSGACSHLDTWDYKPELIRRHGQPMPGMDKVVTFQGELGALTKSPYEFRPRGEVGKYTTDLLPRLGELVDEMCFIHSMTAKSNTHGPGENQMSTGFTLEGFPSIGAWVSYALGSETENLPAFVAIPDPRGVPQAGPINWSNGFLPAVFQGTAFNANQPIRHLARPAGISAAEDLATRDFLQHLNELHLARQPDDTELSARIASYELAARMQLSAPQVSDLAQESARIGSMERITRIHSWLALPRIVCWPGGCSSEACGSFSCSTAPMPWAKAWATGMATSSSRPTTIATGRFWTSPPPRCSPT